MNNLLQFSHNTWNSTCPVSQTTQTPVLCFTHKLIIHRGSDCIMPYHTLQLCIDTTYLPSLDYYLLKGNLLKGNTFEPLCNGQKNKAKKSLVNLIIKNCTWRSIYWPINIIIYVTQLTTRLWEKPACGSCWKETKKQANIITSLR